MGSESSDEAPGIAQKVLLGVFLLVILEPLGMLLYLSVTSPGALEALPAGGIIPGEVGSFLLASPDRLVVAGGLALLAGLLGWNADASGGSRAHGGGGGL